MKPSFNSLLGVLDPFVPQELVAPDVWAKIRKTAVRLAPIYHGGLECRLLADNNRVDLHQYLLQGKREPERLIEHIRRSGWKRHGDWGGIEQICRHWRRPGSSLHQWVSQIWLEFDLSRPVSSIPHPCIFLQLRPSSTDNVIGDDLIRDVLAMLDPQIHRFDRNSLQSALMNCAEHCPSGTAITHIGLMLSRKPERIRVNIRGLSADSWPRYLMDIDWPGPISELSELVDPLYAKTDQLVFCLDVGNRTAPEMGLECLVAAGTNRREAWEDFLEDLVKSGMCASQKRDAILHWGKFIKPPEAAQLWPEDLIAESLLLGPDRFSLISQEINHVKVSYHPSRPPEAKVYLWFGHVWVKKDEVESSIIVQNPGLQREGTDDR